MDENTNSIAEAAAVDTTTAGTATQQAAQQTQQASTQGNAQGASTAPTAGAATMTFDDFLAAGGQAEFDRRVSKALTTAQVRWAAQAEAEKAAAVQAAQAQAQTVVVGALVETELVKAAARDTEVVLPLIDLSKVGIDKDGKLTGVSDQIAALKESKSYLFKDSSQPEAAKKPATGMQHGDQTKDAAEMAEMRRLFHLPPIKS